MDNPIPNVPQGQKKQKSKGFAKSALNVPSKAQAVGSATPQPQGQSPKPQAV
jgi:hypothetical protein